MDDRVLCQRTGILNRQPFVKTYANAVLYNNTGSRLYEQVILGDRVYNYWTGWLRFDGRAVNDLGYANIASGLLAADYEDCYIAEMAAHQNRYSIHVFDGTEPKCVPPEIVFPPPPPKEDCPVLLDLARDGYLLSSAEPAVHFDVDADGTPDSTAWTRRGGDEGFLAMDRNGNGAIDDGTELFGFATPMADGQSALNGYRALAELDDPALGGNADRKIDAADARFSELLVWIDRDRDGRSRPSEIHTLASEGIMELGYEYVATNLTDPFGNLFEYRSDVLIREQSGRMTRWTTYDVVFAESAAAP